MAQQTINIGAAPDDGTGDTARDGGDKINDNFTELYVHKDDTGWNTHGNSATGGGPYIIDGQLSVGPAATTSSVDAVIIVNEETTGVPSQRALDLTYSLDGAGGGNAIGISGAIGSTQTVTAHKASAIGGTYSVNWNPGGAYALAAAYGCKVNISASNTGTLTTAYGTHISGGVLSSTLDEFYAHYTTPVSNLFGTLNLAATAWFEGQINATTNYGIVLDGDNAGADLVLGDTQDASIYYDGSQLVLDSNTGINIGTGTAQEIGLFGVTPVQQPTALTTSDTNTPNSGDATTDGIIANLQTRVDELESKLQALGAVA